MTRFKVHVDEDLPCIVGPRVGIGHRAIIHACTIEEECLIGMGAVLLNGVYYVLDATWAAGGCSKKEDGKLLAGLS